MGKFIEIGQGFRRTRKKDGKPYLSCKITVFGKEITMLIYRADGGDEKWSIMSPNSLGVDDFAAVSDPMDSRD